MKLLNSLSADYWIESTKRIYEERVHISSPVMEAYEAGLLKGIELAAKRVEELAKSTWGEPIFMAKAIRQIPESDDGSGLSLYDRITEEETRLTTKEGK